MAHSKDGNREQFASRLGFLLVSAGCAVGLGNVWRFPYITGEYGGAAFVLVYVLFLVIFALPILIAEFAVGRASQKGFARSFDVLEPAGSKWHVFKWLAIAGNFLLMMFYTVVAGWMIAFAVKSAQGMFDAATVEQTTQVFGAMLGNPTEMLAYLFFVVAASALVCSFGLQNGIEKVTKVMMGALFVLLLVLVVRAVTLPGAAQGLEFYLLPDFSKLFGQGLGHACEAVYAALGQAFFTLGLGIGSMAIFGSYMSKNRSIAGEAVRIAGIDTVVAVMAGLIIFPACFAFGVEPGSGPSLVFITLPNVFGQMPAGRLWCTLFFVFMSFAALSTVIAVFENIMNFAIDQWGLSRKKSCVVNGVLLFVLALPCLLGYNLLADVSIPGIGDIQSIEDFVVSNNILPIGALVYLLFCTSKRGWGFKSFLAEVDSGDGLKFPTWARGYVSYVLPVLIVLLFVGGWLPKIQVWLGM